MIPERGVESEREHSFPILFQSFLPLLLRERQGFPIFFERMRRDREEVKIFASARINAGRRIGVGCSRFGRDGSFSILFPFFSSPRKGGGTGYPCGKIQVEAADPGTLPTRRKVLLLLRRTGSRSGSGSVTERSKKD